MTTQTDRLTGISASVAYKAPCIVAATSNLTLLGAQTVDGVAVVAGDRVLVTGQADASENGIWVVDPGLWSRGVDMNETGDVVEGTAVRVTRGSYAGLWVVTTTGSITIDTTSITFAIDATLIGGLLAANNLSDVSSAFTSFRNLMGNGADIASAASLDLDTVTGDMVDVTGNTGITSVILTEGKTQWVRFTGTPTITVGASLIGNGGGSAIVVAAGDIAMFRGYAAGVVRFTLFRLSGAPTALGTALQMLVMNAGGTAPEWVPSPLGKQGFYIPASSMISKATSGATDGTYDSGASDVTIGVKLFDATTREYAHFEMAMPKGWDEGTVTFVPYWTNTGGTAAQTVVWSMSGRAVGDDDAINGAFGTQQTSDDVVLAQNDLHIGPESSAITIGNTPVEGDLVVFEISRVVASDDMTGDAALIGVILYLTMSSANDA